MEIAKKEPKKKPFFKKKITDGPIQPLVPVMCIFKQTAINISIFILIKRDFAYRL